MATNKLQKNTDKELKKSLKEKRELLRTFRFGLSGSKTRNTKEGESTRKDIARILTELTSRAKASSNDTDK